MCSATSEPSPPLRLWLVRPTLGGGGADRVTLTLLRHLDRRLFSPTLVLMRREGRLLDRVPADVPVHALGARSLWTAWWPLCRRLRRSPPDVLLSTSGGMNVAAALAHRLSGSRCRLVLSERSSLRRRPGSFKERLLLAAKRRLYPGADTVTAVSRGVGDDLVRGFRLAADRVRVVYNPLVDAELEELARRPVEHPWFHDSRPVILAAGRLVPAKRHEDLIDALATLRAAGDARLVVLGDGPRRPFLLRRAAERGVADAVSLPGWDDNPFRYMARCTVFALSSGYEGLPGVLIQAMACGAPVVSTDCLHGPAEIVTDGEDGLLTPVGDPAAMAERLGRLLADPGLRRRLAAAGRRASARFGTDRVVARYAAALLGVDRIRG